MEFNRGVPHRVGVTVKPLGRHSMCIIVAESLLDFKKVNMNMAGNSELVKNSNVVSLFSSIQVEIPDPLQDLLNEAEAEAWDETPSVQVKRLLVTENQQPDQSMYVLDQQLADLNKAMGRLKFYLSDLNDLLPG